MLQTPHTPEKDAAFVSRIRRYDSTEWASPQVTPTSGERLGRRARAGPDAVAAAEPQPEPSFTTTPVAVAGLGRRLNWFTGAARVFAASL